MTWRIEVGERRAEGEAARFEVRVEGRTYDVGVSARDAGELAPGVDDAQLVRESFEFLLEREPPQSIMARFDLPVIARYFPEYPKEIRRRLSHE